MTASRNYIGLPSNNAIIITLSVMYMIVCTTEILFTFSWQLPSIWNFNQISSSNYSSSYIHHYCISFSFAANSPFLWNSVPYTILYTVKGVNCVPFCLAFLPLKQMHILCVCFVVVILLLWCCSCTSVICVCLCVGCFADLSFSTTLSFWQNW